MSVSLSALVRARACGDRDRLLCWLLLELLAAGSRVASWGGVLLSLFLLEVGTYLGTLASLGFSLAPVWALLGM